MTFGDEAEFRHWLVDYLVTNIGCDPNDIDLDLAVNDLGVGSRDAVVLSGDAPAVDAVADRLAGMGRRVHRLAVSHAFHSSLMEPMIEEFGRVAAEVSAAEPRIKLVANVSGQLAGAGYGSPDYWVEHVRRPVRFADGVQTAEALGAGVFVEVGPGAGLAAAIEQSLTAEQPVLVATLAKDRPEIDSLLTAVGRLFTAGLGVDWQAILGGLGGRMVGLPTYGFVRQRFWLGAGRSDGETHAVASQSAGLAKQLQGLDSKEQQRQLVELVCSHAAIVLAHPSGHDIDPERAFQDLGFDSMTGVELRNRLQADTGLALSRTLIFDYPTPTALADHLAQLLLHGREESDEEKIWLSLRNIPLAELRATGLLDKLLLLAGRTEMSLPDPTVSDDVIDSLTPDALIARALDSGDDEIAGGQ